MELVYYVRSSKVRHVLQEGVSAEDISVELQNRKCMEIPFGQTVAKISKGEPYAVVISNGPGSVGWAKCAKTDVFSKKVGLEIARKREKGELPSVEIPGCLEYHVKYMLERSMRVKVWK